MLRRFVLMVALTSVLVPGATYGCNLYLKVSADEDELKKSYVVAKSLLDADPLERERLIQCEKQADLTLAMYGRMEFKTNTAGRTASGALYVKLMAQDYLRRLAYHEAVTRGARRTQPTD